MFFSPLTFLFMFIFLFSLVFFFVFIQINVIALVFARIGIPSQYVFGALFAVLFGSFINIPVKKIPQHTMSPERRVSFFGFRWIVPVVEKRETVLAVNLGGAVISILLSTYLLFKTDLWGSALLATAFMTFVAYRLAKPVSGVGIALPPFLPPILAAVASVVIAYEYAPVVAYITRPLRVPH